MAIELSLRGSAKVSSSPACYIHFSSPNWTLPSPSSLSPTGPQPILFGAVFNREQVFQSIRDQGCILGLPWGSELEQDTAANSSPAPTETSNSSDANV